MTVLISLGITAILVGGLFYKIFSIGMRDLRETPAIPDNDR
ncbi:hypothetical protein [Cupriavidus metallidurans]